MDTKSLSLLIIQHNPEANSKHARWWLKVYRSGIRDVQIIYRPGKENGRADALSRNPVEPEVKEVGIHQVCGQGLDRLLEEESSWGHNVHVYTHPTAAYTTNANIDQTPTHTPHVALMHAHTQEVSTSPETLRPEQNKDLKLRTLISYLEKEELPEDKKEAKRVMLMSQDLVMIDGVLHFVEKGGKRKRVAVPEQLRSTVLQEHHGGVYSGHFSCSKLYGAVSRSWWWPGTLSKLSRLCSGVRIWSQTGTTTPANSCAKTIPDIWSRYYGIARY